MSFSATLVNVFVSVVASSPSTNTFMSSAVSCFVVSKYLSTTLNVIVSVFAVSSVSAFSFSILGFIKSTCPTYP